MITDFEAEILDRIVTEVYTNPIVVKHIEFVKLELWLK